MENFNWTKFKEGKIIVYCKTIEEELNFLQECDKQGLMWCSGVKPSQLSYLKKKCLNGIYFDYSFYGLTYLTPEEVEIFAQAPTFGTPLNTMKGWLASDVKNELLTKSKEAGIPCDSVNNELKTWVSTAREACGESMRVAIKADKSTSYAVIKRVMDSLREIEENRYNLITSLKGVED